MKIFTRPTLGLVMVCLLSMATLAAQEMPSASKIIVKQKVIQENGNFNVIQKEIETTDLANQLNALKSTDGENIEIHLLSKDGENVRITPSEDGTLLYFRESTPRTKNLMKISGDKANMHEQNWNYSNEGRPILGIYAEESEDQKGIVIGSLSTSKGAAAAGLKTGDVITVVDGKTLSTSADLRAALAKHKPGDPVMVTYLRDGQPQQAQVTLAGERVGVRASVDRDPCRVFIGVGTSTRSGDGLHVDYIVGNTPAEVSGVQAGDVILALDNVKVSSQSELELERDKHQPGEAFTLHILREGKPLTINAQFKTCSQEDRQKYEAAQARKQVERQEWTNFLRESRQEEKRDPCEVFIGIYSHAMDGGGRQIDGIIKGTPAEVSKLQKGDIILALDDVPVRTHAEIIRERDKHQPGDRFMLSIMRNGEYLEVDAQFSACDEQPVEAETTAAVVESQPEMETPAIIPQLAQNKALKVEEWNAYPNPTFGKLNVQFRAEAVPTNFQILDASGKTVYEETLNRFDGFYQKQLKLDGNMPGVYVLVVRQGDKIFYNKVVLLAKA